MWQEGYRVTGYHLALFPTKNLLLFSRYTTHLHLHTAQIHSKTWQIMFRIKPNPIRHLPVWRNSGCQLANMQTIHCPHGAEVLVLTFRESEVSREVRLLSTGRARGLQLENGCSERPNPQGFKWDFVHTGCTHIPTHIWVHTLRRVYRHTGKSFWQTQETLKIGFKANYAFNTTWFIFL